MLMVGTHNAHGIMLMVGTHGMCSSQGQRKGGGLRPLSQKRFALHRLGSMGVEVTALQNGRALHTRLGTNNKSMDLVQHRYKSKSFAWFIRLSTVVKIYICIM